MGAYRYGSRIGYLLFGTVSGVSGALVAATLLKNETNSAEIQSDFTRHKKLRTKWDDNWDRRSPKMHKYENDKLNVESNDGTNGRQVEVTPTASRHILLIRHGQYTYDAATDCGRILTELGRQQAELCGIRLRELSLPYTRFVTSTMARAIETGAIVFKHLDQASLPPIEACSMLREGAPIEPEPPVGHFHPEASQYYEDGARIEAAFRKYIHRADVEQKEDSYEVIVCHANVIRYFACRALQLPPEAWLRIGLNHASITWLVVRPSGRVSLRALGDSGFLPASKLSS